MSFTLKLPSPFSIAFVMMRPLYNYENHNYTYYNRVKLCLNVLRDMPGKLAFVGSPTRDFAGCGQANTAHVLRQRYLGQKGGPGGKFAYQKSSFGWQGAGWNMPDSQFTSSYSSYIQTPVHSNWFLIKFSQGNVAISTLKKFN